MNEFADMTSKCARVDCSIQLRSSSMTCIGWTPTFDRNGRKTSDDPNITTSVYHCTSCGRTWKVSTQFGKSQIEEQAPLARSDDAAAQTETPA
jgi:hypothetical protein